MRNPYVTGSYVTGRQHYGRETLIDCLLHGEGRAYWVVGSRRIGKTSLLRQLELRALEDADSTLIPIVWDMQGCNSFACLSRYLADAVSDHPERFEPLQLPVKMLRSENASVFLAQARRRAVQAGRELFLLCDETEVLINIARSAPQAMQQLHKQLTAGAGLRVVMATGDELTTELLPPTVTQGTGAKLGNPRLRAADLESLTYAVVERGLMDSGPNEDNLHAKIVNRVERELIAQVMINCNQVQTKAATRLGINRNTLHKKLKEYNLEG